MAHFPYRVVSIDIDGTLLSSKGVVLPSTTEWLTRVQGAGGHVLISSGRPITGVHPIVERGGLNGPVAISGYNGALVHNADGEVVGDHRVSAEWARKVFTFGRDLPASTMVCVDDRLITDDRNGFFVAQECEVNRLDLEVIDDLRDLTEATHKVLFTAEPEEMARCYPALRAEFGDQLMVTQSDPRFCEISDPSGHKGAALADFCASVNVPISQAIAFGDAANDHTMIEMAGLGVAMGNAIDSIRQIADRVTTTNNDDGIARILEEFFSGKDVS